MRRLPVVLAGLLVALLVQPPAAAGPSRALCASAPARGAVPAGFVVDTCVDAAAVTMRNRLEVPVLIRAGGDVGAPVRVTTSGGPAAALLRSAADEGDVLMPGDVVRWPLGPGAAELIVTDTDLRIPATIADTLAPFLPDRESGRPDTVDEAAFGALVREIAPAVTARAACVRDRNFLQRAACDVDASGAVAEAVAHRVPAGVAADVLTQVLDPGLWLEWSSSARMAVGLPDTGRRRLVLEPRPVPPTAVPLPRASMVSRTAPQPAAVPAPLPAPAPLPGAPPTATPASPPAAPPAAPGAGPDDGGKGEGGKKADDDRGHDKARGYGKKDD